MTRALPRRRRAAAARASRGPADSARARVPIALDLVVAMVVSLAANAAHGAFCPSTATFSDSFEDGALGPWQSVGGPPRRAGVSQATAGDGTHSAFVRRDSIIVRSPRIDLAAATSAELGVWVRRGDDAFSEDPDAGEDLVLEYLNDGNDWVALQTFSGAGTPGEIFEPSFALPADAFHKSFRVRFRFTGGGPGGSAGYWHMDNICLTSVGSGNADHWAVAHDGSAVSCADEPITITAHNPGHNPIDPGNVTIDIDAINQDTGNGEGTWARVLTGSGTLTDATAGDGAASYTFPGNGETGVTLAFNYTDIAKGTSETVNFDINGGNEDAAAGEDPDLTVKPSGFRITDGSGNPINVPAQIAAKPSDMAPGAQALGLQAIRTSDSDPSVCEPAFPDGTTVEVGLAAECKDPATCAGNELAVTNDGNTTAIDTSDDDGGSGAASYEPVDLLFGANAEADIVLAYPDAGAIQFHARHDPIDDSGDAPTVKSITGASNDFVVRPFGFFIDFDPDGDGIFDDRTVNATCGAQTSCAADAGGDVFATAGASFGVQLEAVVWASGDDGDDDGVPDSNQAIADNALTPNFGNEASPETVDLAHTLVAPSGGRAGTLSGGAGIGGFSGGRATATGVSWDEVGIIDLAAALSDGAYLGAGDATGLAPNLGRFIPTDFEQTVADPGLFEAVHDNRFTYTGQQFGYNPGSEPELTITARNAAAATTRNYTGNFAKLVAGDVDRTAPAADGTQAGRDGTPLPVTASLNTGSLTDNGDGTLTYAFATAEANDPNDPANPAAGVDAYTYERNIDRDGDGVNDARVAPFDTDLTVTVDAIEDSDGVTAAVRNDVTPDPTEIRFGRLLVDSAAGAEIAAVNQPVRAEYWDGDTWLLNTDDNTTALKLGGGDNEVRLANNDDPDSPVAGDQPIDVADGTTEIDDSTNPIPLVAGELELTFAAPGAGNTGWVDTTAILGAQDHPYLRTDPDDDGVWDSEPTGRVTFGVFTGNADWIHFRRPR